MHARGSERIQEYLNHDYKHEEGDVKRCAKLMVPVSNT